MQTPPDPARACARLLQRTRFLTSATRAADCPPDTGREVAFAGRSNAGKSSALNVLTQQNSLARVSKTPGRTQLINFFETEAGRRLVDLPGYGYAKVSHETRDRWQDGLSDYLERRDSLIGLVLVMDVRHPLTDFDTMMLEWCMTRGLPAHCLLTKTDKLSRGAAAAAVQGVRRDIARWPGVTAQGFSSTARTGLEEAWLKIGEWLDVQAPTAA